MSDIKLKPCPFCGGKAIFGLGEELRKKYQRNDDWVKCSWCGSETACYDTPEKAAEAWNRRMGGQNERD